MTAVPWWAAYLVNPIRVGFGGRSFKSRVSRSTNPGLTLPFLREPFCPFDPSQYTFSTSSPTQPTYTGG